MKLIAFVGHSNTGKTTLVEHIVRELKQRGAAVGVVKHTGHGFSLDGKGRDTWKFTKAGADGVMAVSGNRLFLHRKREPGDSILSLIHSAFSHMDWVLLEGGKREAGIPKIEVIRKDVSEDLLPEISNRIAVAADFEFKAAVPVFQTEDINEIVNFLEGQWKKQKRQ